MTDDTSHAQARAVHVGAFLGLLGAAQAAVLVVGRPARTMAVAAAVAAFVLRLVAGDLSPRRLVFDVLTTLVLACFVVRGLRRMPRILQAEDRTPTLHALG